MCFLVWVDIEYVLRLILTNPPVYEVPDGVLKDESNPLK
jgi:hypothetical protein